jgi:hypothetical protein
MPSICFQLNIYTPDFTDHEPNLTDGPSGTASFFSIQKVHTFSCSLFLNIHIQLKHGSA